MEQGIKIQVKNLLDNPAWVYVEQIFKDEVLEGKKPLNFKTEGKTTEMIALECMAREKAGIMVDNVLKKLNRIRNEKEYQKESFK